MVRLQPATKIRKCQVCGEEYEYPVKGSVATRFHCELCVNLPQHIRKVFERMARRIQALERALKQEKK